MLRRMMVGCLVLALCAGTLYAQDTGRGRGRGGQPGRGMQPGGGGPMMLLGIEDVRKELKLTDEQTKKLDEFRKKQQEMFSGMRDLSAEERRKKMQEMQSKMQEMNKEVTAMLTPEQSKRLKQLQLQAGSVMQALNNEEVKKELNLTSEQTDKIKAIADDMRAQMNELRQGGGGDRQEMAKKSEELRKSTETKVMGVLTDEQKAKWKELMGEPFKGNLRPQMGRRPGGVIG